MHLTVLHDLGYAFAHMRPMTPDTDLMDMLADNVRVSPVSREIQLTGILLATELALWAKKRGASREAAVREALVAHNAALYRGLAAHAAWLLDEVEIAKVTQQIEYAHKACEALLRAWNAARGGTEQGVWNPCCKYVSPRAKKWLWTWDVLHQEGCE